MRLLLSTLLTTTSVLLLNNDNVVAAASEERTVDMLVTPHPLATKAGYSIFRKGGGAADALVAIQAVLGLVEPQASGLGGGGFAIYYDAATGKTTTFDGRETAPATATCDRFASFSGPTTAWQSGLAVGVPGTPRLLETLHSKFGRLPWDSKLFEDAKQLALEGFELSERTASLTARLLGLNRVGGFDCETRFFWRDPTAFDYLVDYQGNGTECTAKPAGTILTNPEYAATLDLLATKGVDAFYTGEIAEAIVDAVQNDPSNPGDMTLEDLANYTVLERDPVCIAYKDTKQICGMGPPSSGGIAVNQIMAILEQINVTTQSTSPLDVDVVHAFTQAGRLAFADRNQYVADPEFVNVPVEGLLDQDYLAGRASLVNMESDMGIAVAGVPPGVVDENSVEGLDPATKSTGTSHISIVDRCGNAVSMTSSIESPFGNGVMVKGFFLNNELTDFALEAIDAQGRPVANRVEGNKRPRSSMAPTIVLDSAGRPELLTGTAGGSKIIGFTAQSIFSTFDFDMDPQSVVDLPHYLQENEKNTYVEPPIPNVTPDDYDDKQLVMELEARNHSITQRSLAISGLAMIKVRSARDGYALLGGADQRRDTSVGGTNGSISCEGLVVIATAEGTTASAAFRTDGIVLPLLLAVIGLVL